MAYQNTPIRGAFGDSFLVRTPHIDRAVNVLYQEQRNRELAKQKANEDLEKEFNAMIPGVRSGDAPKLSEYWTDYKTAWKTLQAKPPKTTQENIEAQQDLYRKKAVLYAHIKASKDKGEQEKITYPLLAKDNKGMFRDDAHTIFKQGLQKPYDEQLEIIDPTTGTKTMIDWTNPDQLKRHIDTKGVFDAIKLSTGTEKPYSGERYKANPTDLQFIQPEIYVKNRPIDFYNNMKLAAQQKPIDFLNTLPHPTPEEYFEVRKKYNELPAEIKKNWKIKDGEDIPDDNELKSALEKAIAYQAMTYALNPNNQPRVVNKTISDVDAKDRRDFAQAKELQASSNRNAINRLYTASGLRKANDNDEDVLTMDAVLHNVSDIINEGEKELPKDKMAGFFGVGNIPIADPNLLKTFSGIKKAAGTSTPIPPNSISFDKKKDQFILDYGSEGTIPISSRDYIRLKIQEMNPTKNKGELNAIADKIISANGGLYNTIKKYSQPAPTDKYNKYEVK